LGEVPSELRVTPEKDQRLLEQAQSLAETDAVRLLDLVSAALEATTNGAQARIQLELVLIKAAAPEVDPSTAALLARIGGREAGLPRGPGPRRVDHPPPQGAPGPAPEPAPVQPVERAAVQAPEPASVQSPPPPTPPLPTPPPPATPPGALD